MTIIFTLVRCASPPHRGLRFPLPLRMATWQNRPRDPLLSQVGVSGGIVMKAIFRAGSILLACALTSIEIAAAQPANMGCSSENSISVAQTLHCEGGVTIIAESGARFTLQDTVGKGRVDALELNNKALLIEVPKKSGGNRFQVITPQAIAAVRGTKWAVDAAENKTSVFVVNGRVAVGRRTGSHSVTLGAGEGVDVEAAGPLTVKRWPSARVSALLARLGQ
ncbi:MAG: FecR domain-containing protein [Bradyrhizobium sp.]